MVASQMINEQTKMTADYDSLADVLYVMLNAPEQVEGDGKADGIELDYSMKSGKPCGVTVIGYKQYGWHGKVEKLAKIVGEHLTVQPKIVSSIVDELMTAKMH
jgi:uncharacterized protein YuzE